MFTVLARACGVSADRWSATAAPTATDSIRAGLGAARGSSEDDARGGAAGGGQARANAGERSCVGGGGGGGGIATGVMAHDDSIDLRAPWSAEEDATLLEGVRRHGCRWRVIVASLPGRSDSSTRNRYNRLLREGCRTSPSRSG